MNNHEEKEERYLRSVEAGATYFGTVARLDQVNEKHRLELLEMDARHAAEKFALRIQQQKELVSALAIPQAQPEPIDENIVFGPAGGITPEDM